MAANALGPCVTRSSAAMILIVGEYIPVLYGQGPQLPPFRWLSDIWYLQHSCVGDIIVSH